MIRWDFWAEREEGERNLGAGKTSGNGEQARHAGGEVAAMSQVAACRLI